VDRTHESLRLAVVAQSLPRRFHAAGDGGVRDDTPVPHLVDDFFLRDEALAVLDQQRQQREDLRLEFADSTAVPQLDRG